MQVQLVIFFQCDTIDEPEEMLVLNVQHGKPITIRLHGYKDPPILKGRYVQGFSSGWQICLTITRRLVKVFYIRARSIATPLYPNFFCSTGVGASQELMSNGKFTIQPWHSEILSPCGSIDSTVGSTTESAGTWFSICRKLDNKSMTFDCGNGFVGEQVHVPMKFTNTGGEGRFFIMSEIDWTSLCIEDITATNVLKLPCFAVWPAYFLLKPREEIMLHTYFFSYCYGIHVDKLYILCDNCTLLDLEIIGDGVIYEPNFIQLSKQLEKVWPLKMGIDKHARYYVNLNYVSNGMGQCTISATNTSEISMRFRWTKRHIQSNENETIKRNRLPLEFLRIHPDHGVFAPTSIHHFNVTAEYKYLNADCLFAVLQLHLEDIPLAAISKELQLHTKECTMRRRRTAASVDIWIADVEVWLQCTADESKTDETSEEDMHLDRDYSIPDYYEGADIIDDSEDSEDHKSACQLVRQSRFSRFSSLGMIFVQKLPGFKLLFEIQRDIRETVKAEREYAEENCPTCQPLDSR
ncbi:uncharacterized protein LOC143377524 [Andrena cerasifolii]|uniref:uncharacterized protein LOC143377524 n=1 Tax=Andrena cerasifolii TaxID=2819439 RepID=UPI004037F745